MFSAMMLKPILGMVKSEQIKSFFEQEGETVIKWLINHFTPKDIELTPEEISVGASFIPYQREGHQHIIGVIQTFNNDGEPVRLINRFDLEKYLQEKDYSELLNLIKENLG